MSLLFYLSVFKKVYPTMDPMEIEVEQVPSVKGDKEWQHMIAELLTLHPHCNDCIARDCKEGCDMNDCACGAKFHSCKSDEHEELCPISNVPCLNVEYGCPLTMPRHSRAAHLETCPASVVVCSFEWGRIPQQPKITVANQLDTQFAFRDQKNLEGALFPLSLINKNAIPLNTKLLKYLKDHEKRIDLVKNELQENPDPNAPWPLIVNTTVEFGTRFNRICDNEKYMFICGEEVRRDMFSWHYKNLHSDIFCGLNDCLIQRCPLQSLGCNFSRRRLYPDTPTAMLVFDNKNEVFAIRYETDTLISETTAERSHLCQLPPEVLERICGYLDPQSLGSLSLTCHQLRDFCSSAFLERQGIVNLVWRKTDDSQEQTNWVIINKSWRFPHFFTPVKKWGVHQHPPMAHHLMECDKNERCINKTPFKLVNELPLESNKP